MSIKKLADIIDKILLSKDTENIRKIVVDICKLKNRLILEKTNICLFDKRDFDDLNNWEYFQYIKFLSSLLHSIDKKFLTDSKFCPWCSKFLVCEKNDYNCSGCNYGERHGYCLLGNEDDILYFKVRKALNDMIYNIEGLLEGILEIIYSNIK